MEKAPGPSPESSEEPIPKSERPILSKKEQDDADFRDQLQSFFERSGDKEIADTVAAESKDQEHLARGRQIDAELEASKRKLDEINESVRRGERAAGESFDERAEKELARIHELEAARLRHEKESGVIELTEDMVIKDKERDKYNKTLEDEPTADDEAFNLKKEKTKEKDLLSEARPRVRERLEALGMRATATVMERGVIAFGNKGIDLYERLKGYPSLKRERAQKAADDIERALQVNKEEQAKYGSDSKMLEKLRAEHERQERALIDARGELGMRQAKEEKFQARKRAFEGGMRTFASEILQDIDKRLAPFDRQLEVARTNIEQARKRIGEVKRRLDMYEDQLAEKRSLVRKEQDPLQRKILEDEVAKILNTIKSQKPLLSRIIQQEKSVQKKLTQNEERFSPFRQQQRRFARAAGLEVHQSVLAKGAPPEDLPVQPRGGLRMIEGGKSRTQKDTKQESQEAPSKIDTFIKRWNREAALDGRFSWRIKDLEYFKYLAGSGELSASRIEHLVRKYFEDKATRAGTVLSLRQYRKAERIGRLVAGKVFPEGNIVKRSIKKAL